MVLGEGKAGPPPNRRNMVPKWNSSIWLWLCSAGIIHCPKQTLGNREPYANVEHIICVSTLGKIAGSLF